MTDRLTDLLPHSQPGSLRSRIGTWITSPAVQCDWELISLLLKGFILAGVVHHCRNRTHRKDVASVLRQMGFTTHAGLVGLIFLQVSWAILNFGLNLKGTSHCIFLLNQFIHSYSLLFSVKMLLPIETRPIVLPTTKRENQIYNARKRTLCEALPAAHQDLKPTGMY